MLEPQIIYEDENCLVVNKPAGLLVHGDGLSQEKSLVDWLLARYPDVSEVGLSPRSFSEVGLSPRSFSEVGLGLRNFSEVGESMFNQKGLEIKKPGIAHRLDKETSGVMIIAKTQPAYNHFKNQFQNHELKKTYRAILSGHINLPKGEEKILDWPIGRSNKDPRIRVARLGGRGKQREARTTFRLLEDLSQNYSYVEAEPETGRTHQLRAHFKAYGHPIIGDHLYNPRDNGGGAINRVALHAYELTIKLLGGEEKTFRAPLPVDFEQALEKLRASC